MELRLNKKYKSLEPFTVELPTLTILTGVNGAGKTQILTAINENQMNVVENDVGLNPKKHVTHQTLFPNDSSIVTTQELSQKQNQVWNNYNLYIQNYESNPAHPSVHNNSFIKIFKKIANESGKGIREISKQDFDKFYPLNDDLDPDKFFAQNFSTLFKRYNYNLDNNKYRKYRFNEEKEKEIVFISDKEFSKLYGEPPWNFVNKILEEANLDYRINSPINDDRDTPFEAKLINNLNNAEIKFSDLSSGEKTLMSLALALYNSQFDVEFPKLLLMDEPDASLHPSMTKQFLDVIQKVFVKGKGVRVIFTTHSPSTVALAPEEAIFIVEKTGKRIKNASKDEALKILTAGVPSFSVNYENRRQVFVESHNDVYFYEKIYEKLSSYLEPEISLSFISSGESKTDKYGQKVSNCDQVENITKILREAGNKFIFGIIDWDAKNTSNGYLRVLGENERYSIENYILDPILISALLLREKVITRDELGLTDNENYSDFKHLSLEKLQFISNFLTDKIATKVLPTDSTMKTVKFLNENEIEVPIWYLEFQGHNLETQLKELFPQLNKFNKEEALKKEVIDKIIDDIPEFISNDILEVFRQIQTDDFQ